MNPAWFGDRLRELREAAGLSRKELAEKAGMKSEAGIRNIEQGIRLPGWDTVLALAKALGVSCEAFTQEPATGTAEPRKAGRPRKRAEEPSQEPAPAEVTPAEVKKPIRKKKPKE